MLLTHAISMTVDCGHNFVLLLTLNLMFVKIGNINCLFYFNVINRYDKLLTLNCISYF